MDLSTLLTNHGVVFTYEDNQVQKTWNLTYHNLIITQTDDSEFLVYESKNDVDPYDIFWPEDADAWVKALPEPEDDPMCTTCNGSGEGMYDGTRCRACGGKGVQRHDPD